MRCPADKLKRYLRSGLDDLSHQNAGSAEHRHRQNGRLRSVCPAGVLCFSSSGYPRRIFVQSSWSAFILVQPADVHFSAHRPGAILFPVLLAQKALLQSLNPLHSTDFVTRRIHQIGQIQFTTAAFTNTGCILDIRPATCQARFVPGINLFG